MRLARKNVTYVGGFGGIGFSCIKGMLQKGVKNLRILDVKENKAMLKELQECMPDACIKFMPLDLTKGKSVIEKAITKAHCDMGHADILVNGSGIVRDSDPEATIKINLLGLIQSTLVGYSLMSKDQGGKGGRMVHIASVLGLAPASHICIYTATKHGVIGFHRSLSDPYYEKLTGISHVAICPGYTTDTVIWDEFADDEKSKAMPTFPEISQPLIERLSTVETQTADENTTSMINAIEKGKNGSIWICDLGKLKEVNYTKFWEHPFKK